MRINVYINKLCCTINQWNWRWAGRHVTRPIVQGALWSTWVYLGMLNTHYHALQSTLGQPAVEKHWDKQVSERRPEDLTQRENQILLSDVVWHVILNMLLTVMMKGTVFNISNRKDTWNICSHILPWKNIYKCTQRQSVSNISQSKMQELDTSSLRFRANRVWKINNHVHTLLIGTQTHLVAEVH